MSIYFRIKTTFKATSRNVFVSFTKALGIKLTNEALLIPGLKVAGSVFTANAGKLEDLTVDTKNHVPGAAESAIIIVKQIRNDFRVDAYSVEAAVNAAQDPTIATKAGFEVVKTKGKNKTPELSITNAITNGSLKIKTRKIKKYHYFLIECTQKFSDGSADIITEKSMPDPTSEVSGFISGALYLIRVRVVLAGNIMGEWTDYVLIRVN